MSQTGSTGKLPERPPQGAQVVVSFDEAPGSNRFLTRDQVGRVICNCMVFGRRVEFEPIPLASGEEAAQGTR